MRRLLITCMMFIGLGCGSAPRETASFSQLVDGFDSVQACRDATQGGNVFNCERTLTLCSNGGFQVIVTDIQNEGRYEMNGSAFTATLSEKLDGGGPIEIHGTLDHDGVVKSTSLNGSHPWVRAIDANAESTCEALTGRLWW